MQNNSIICFFAVGVLLEQLIPLISERQHLERENRSTQAAAQVSNSSIFSISLISPSPTASALSTSYI